jgi:Phosphotransferase enzyme family
MRFEELHNLKHLLKQHDVSLANWVEMSQRGFSGARIYKHSHPEGSSYVLKVTSAGGDWIMRATSDYKGREAILANAAWVRDGQVSSPAIGSAQDGAVFSILMHDISEYLLANERLTHDQLNAILRGMSRLHSLVPPREADVPWCSVENRLTLFMPDPEKLASFRIANDILRGWELFFEHAPGSIGDLVRSLFDDIGPLKRALGQLPSCFLHGDLKLDNIGIHPDGTLSLIDWSMPMMAPAAIDLGWFLAMNSRTLPLSLDETLAAYTSCSTIEGRLHERHQALTILCGLLIRGWRKGLDAGSGEPSELGWWCERASSAAKLL